MFVVIKTKLEELTKQNIKNNFVHIELKDNLKKFILSSYINKFQRCIAWVIFYF